MWLSILVPILAAQGLFQTSSYFEYHPYFFSFFEPGNFSRDVTQSDLCFTKNFQASVGASLRGSQEWKESDPLSSCSYL